MRNLLRKILSFTRGEYYKSIEELPLYNWIKCNDGDLEYTRVKGKGNKINDLINWERLYNEYLSDFGLNERYKKYLEAQRKKALLESEYLIKKDKFKLTEIEIQKQRIKDLEVYFGDGQKIEVILTWLSMFLGYKLNKKDTSVTEYFTILEQYGKANKKV